MLFVYPFSVSFGKCKQICIYSYLSAPYTKSNFLDGKEHLSIFPQTFSGDHSLLTYLYLGLSHSFYWLQNIADSFGVNSLIPSYVTAPWCPYEYMRTNMYLQALLWALCFYLYLGHFLVLF